MDEAAINGTTTAPGGDTTKANDGSSQSNAGNTQPQPGAGGTALPTTHASYPNPQQPSAAGGNVNHQQPNMTASNANSGDQPNGNPAAGDLTNGNTAGNNQNTGDQNNTSNGNPSSSASDKEKSAATVDPELQAARRAAAELLANTQQAVTCGTSPAPCLENVDRRVILEAFQMLNRAYAAKLGEHDAVQQRANTIQQELNKFASQHTVRHDVPSKLNDSDKPPSVLPARKPSRMPSIDKWDGRDKTKSVNTFLSDIEMYADVYSQVFAKALGIHTTGEVRESWELELKLWRQSGLYETVCDNRDFIKKEFKHMIGFIDEDDDAYKIKQQFAKGQVRQKNEHTVQQYFAHFENKRLIAGLSEEIAIPFFIQGLKGELKPSCQRDVHGKPFNTLSDLLRHAQGEEVKHALLNPARVNFIKGRDDDRQSNNRGRGRGPKGGRGSYRHVQGNQGKRNNGYSGHKRERDGNDYANQDNRPNKGGPSGSRGGNSSGDKYCIICKKKGHTVDNCWFNARVNPNGSCKPMQGKGPNPNNDNSGGNGMTA